MNLVDIDSIPEMIREARKIHGLTLRELDKLSGVSTQTILNIEQRKSSPSIATVKKIMGAFQRLTGEEYGE